MRHPYADLYSLFRHEPRAEEYFNRLPDYVQDQITARPFPREAGLHFALCPVISYNFKL